MQKQTLRKLMRQKRRLLTPSQQKLAGHRLTKICQRSLHFSRNRRIAIYLPNDGEIDPRPLIESLQQRGIHCYLPVLHPIKKNCLWFCIYTPKTTMQTNRFGIPEPDIKKTPRTPPWTLSWALFPLVAFDQAGGRLGMGGGFYDRTFALSKRKHNPLFHKVKLAGLAHHFQMVEKLPTEPWDVPLEAIVSDQFALKFKKQTS